jgi:hypothetical protein
LATKALGFVPNSFLGVKNEFDRLSCPSWDRLYYHLTTPCLIQNQFTLKAHGLAISPSSLYTLYRKYMPITYTLHHVNALSNLISPLAVLYQTLTSTYHILKANQGTKIASANGELDSVTSDSINRKSKEIIFYQWGGGVSNLMLMGISSYASYYMPYFYNPQNKEGVYAVRRITLAIGLLSGLGELILNGLTTWKVRNLAREAVEILNPPAPQLEDSFKS